VLKVLVLLVVAAGLLQMVITLVQRKRQRAAQSRLWLDGVAARARVIACREVGGYRYGDRRVELELEVVQSSTAQVEVVVPVGALQELQPGCVIDVRYDPEDPTRVALDPMLSGSPH
jgi:hypothetical protein